MIKIEEIARPYAHAAFEWATEHKQIAKWQEMLDALAIIVSDNKIQIMLKSPSYNISKKTDILLDMAQDSLNEEGKNLVKLLAEYHRLSILPEIYRQFILLKEAAENTLEAEVTTARPLSTQLQTQLISALEKRTGAKIQLHTQVDETLLGGMTIRVGDEIIDSSILGQLQRLAHYLQLKENICQ